MLVSETAVPSPSGSMRPRKMGGVTMRRGCKSRRRASSAPAYPVTPATAVQSAVREPALKLSNVGLDPVLDGEGPARVLADDEDGVVAGDRADDFGPLFVVDGGSDGLRAAGAGDDDDEVERLAGFEAEVLQDLVDGGLVVFVSAVAVVGERVAIGAFGEFELVHVARKRGLGDVVALGGEFAAQLLLVGDAAGDGGLRQEVADCAVPVALQNMPRAKREKRDADAVTRCA